MQPNRPHEAAFVGVGITFCRVPLVLDSGGLSGADVAILGAPFDEGVSYRPGARFGPRAIRLAEDVGMPPSRPHMELGVDPFAELRVVDYGDVEAVPADLAASHAALRRMVGEILSAGALPVVLGGDHSLSAPVMQALAERFGPDGYAVIHLDTHADTGAEVHGVANSHGTPFYRGVTEGFMRGDHVFQFGLRGAWPSPEEFAWMRRAGFRWRTMEECLDRGLDAVVAEAVTFARERAPRVYLSVDIDALDPAFAPGTGTPEPGGFSTRELLRAVRRIAGLVDLAAMDVVEVSPPYDVAGVTALAAHRLVLETVSAVALRKSGQAARPARWESA
ncbi:MAG TPA: agmatinase [Thermomicrobiales bacterium]|nr:agmatinase [Thermomicrobiales bacterium]